MGVPIPGNLVFILNQSLDFRVTDSPAECWFHGVYFMRLAVVDAHVFVQEASLGANWKFDEGNHQSIVMLWRVPALQEAADPLGNL